jgi:hypothetical protein
MTDQDLVKDIVILTLGGFTSNGSQAGNSDKEQPPPLEGY